MLATTRLIALNASNGALVAVAATTKSSRVTGREDEAATSQGLIYTRGDDVNANVNTVGTVGTPDQQQIDLWDNRPFGPQGGSIVGLPQQNSSGSPFFQAATTYFSAKSKSSATTLRVIEYP